jgi:hypothetical protein
VPPPHRARPPAGTLLGFCAGQHTWTFKTSSPRDLGVTYM